VQQIVGLCIGKTYEEETTICHSDVVSDEMYILVTGKLRIITGDGIEVAWLTPVTTVGEMGMITQQTRSATVIATEPSYVLTIQSPPFELLLRQNVGLQARIYRNIIDILSKKIINDNVRSRDHMVQHVRYENDLNFLRQRAEATMNLLLKQSDMTRQEAEMHLDEQLKNVSMRVLIIDDEADIRRFVKRALSAYSVMEAGNGNEALLLIQNEPPDLVITDIRMPEMDGLTLLSHLKKNHPNIPVLGLSGYVPPEEFQFFNFDGYIPKPIKLDDFRNLVEQTINR
jgi:CheY-like chemotaxis protein